MRRVAFLAVAASLLTASAVWADPDTTSTAPAAPAPDAKPATPGAKPKVDMNDPNRIVCTREHVVGSNRPQKICMTVAERQRLKDSADRDMDISKHNIDTSMKASDGTN